MEKDRNVEWRYRIKEDDTHSQTKLVWHGYDATSGH